MSESEARQKLPGLSSFLSREYRFSTQADTTEAMAMGREIAAGAYQAGAESSKWIPVTPETLPRNNVDLLFVMNDAGIGHGWLAGDRWIDELNTLDDRPTEVRMEHVSAWQYVPAPPVRDQKEASK